MSTGKSTRIAALGYYGFRNLGDEAVLAGIRHALAGEIGEAVDLLVLSNDPGATEVFHPGVRAVNRWQWRESAAAMRGTDLFILGGGSLLQDATSVKSVLWYALMAMMARRRSRRVLWWGQGVGPLTSQASRRLVRWIADQADAITVRDKNSADLLQTIGCRRSIEVVADPAFALEPASSGVTTGRDSCLLALRPWRDDRLLQLGDGGLLAALRRSFGAQQALTALPMHLPGDRRFAESLPGFSSSNTAVMDWAESGATIEETIGSVAQARYVVAMRLHALIFAVRCAIPFVALSYDPKVDALATAAGQEDILVSVESLDVAALQSALHGLTRNADARRERLQSFALEQGQLARRPAMIAAGLLAEGGKPGRR